MGKLGKFLKDIPSSSKRRKKDGGQASDAFNQGRTSPSLHLLGFIPHTGWQDLKKLWEANILFLWSCLFAASGTSKTWIESLIWAPAWSSHLDRESHWDCLGSQLKSSWRCESIYTPLLSISALKVFTCLPSACKFCFLFFLALMKWSKESIERDNGICSCLLISNSFFPLPNMVQLCF